MRLRCLANSSVKPVWAKASPRDLADRAGISRGLLQRIERGDPGCTIGVVFEVATLCGEPLFDQGQRQLTTLLDLHREKMALLPRAVRTYPQAVKDDF
jgi:transcriptional regulator with XRE-family HTH domain